MAVSEPSTTIRWRLSLGRRPSTPSRTLAVPPPLAWHPLGATGLAQCAELNWQLRGLAEKRQVPGAKVALQHNLGLGGAAVVTMYRKSDVG